MTPECIHGSSPVNDTKVAITSAGELQARLDAAHETICNVEAKLRSVDAALSAQTSELEDVKAALGEELRLALANLEVRSFVMNEGMITWLLLFTMIGELLLGLENGGCEDDGPNA